MENEPSLSGELLKRGLVAAHLRRRLFTGHRQAISEFRRAGQTSWSLPDKRRAAPS